MAYNFKVFDYGDTYQVRIYDRPVLSHDEKLIYLDDENNDSSTYSDNFYEMSDEEKLEHSIISSMNRTKNQIYGIARANSWDGFLTFTFNKMYVDRTDYDVTSSKIRKWLNNVKNRFCPDLKYLVVPELHEDGVSWHAHALVANIHNLPVVDSGIVSKGKRIYNIPGWRYGWTTLSYVEDSKRIALYMCKYITKDFCSLTQFRRRYWASHNCTKLKDVQSQYLIEKESLFFQEYGDIIDNISSVKSPRGNIKYIEIDAQDLDINES